MKMYKIGTCEHCTHSIPERPNKTVQQLIDEGKIRDTGMLRCNNNILSVNNKQVFPHFGCIYWEYKDVT